MSKEDASAQQELEWGYEEENGPKQWCCLKDEFAICEQGRAQSPIDLTGATHTPLSSIAFAYQPMPLAIFNNGRTIQVNCAPGSCITYNEKRYDLVQFHFHYPSEHTIDGQAAAMELHFVHQHATSSNFAVVGVMLIQGETANTAYQPIFSNLPTEISEPDPQAAQMIQPADLLPEDVAHYFTYEGSLTTPPCTESVRWLILAQPVALSADQFAAFAAIYDHNARPVQPRNNRDLFMNGV